MVVNEVQFSDRQLYLTDRLYFSIRTGRTIALSDRISCRGLDMSEDLEVENITKHEGS